MKTNPGLNALLFLLTVVTINGFGVEPLAHSDGDFVSLRAGSASFSASQYVVIDQSEPAFIVFTGIPKGLDKEKIESLRQEVSRHEKLTMLTWQQFLTSVDKYARSVIIKKDYPSIRVVDGIVCLVGSKQGTGAPWGLTWNGGIALTFNDYQHARQTFKAYKANPSAYKPIGDPRRDPIHPSGHLPFAGCE